MLVVLFVLFALVVAADRLAAAYAENRIATEIQKEGFGTKPDVSIKGFPFLTQVLNRHFSRADLTARKVPAGPVVIDSIEATARNIRTDSSFRSGTIGSVAGTGTIAFGDLTKAGGEPGLRLHAAGPDTVTADVDLDFATATATAKVTREGDKIRVHAVSVEGFPLSDLGDTLDFTVPVTGLPMGMALKSLSVTTKGIVLRVTGSNIAFKQ